MNYRKKLIEVALPLPDINNASAYDKMPGAEVSVTPEIQTEVTDSVADSIGRVITNNCRTLNLPIALRRSDAPL